MVTTIIKPGSTQPGIFRLFGGEGNLSAKFLRKMEK